ncbi:unnamed protein product [Blepharisma stoltei]|uniref:Fe2OG dioxygenase domain-containing protein n=1 Tax=Blepharisma stoltei TaxID=1481888 RepID=A0AAU9JHK9_9CILI|nr:unnamed protein product [Blepharisma stoltei]
MNLLKIARNIMNTKKKEATALKGLMKKMQKGKDHIMKNENFSQYFQDEPSADMFLLHYSDGQERDFSIIKSHLSSYGEIKNLVVIPGINYGFLTYSSIDSAISAYNSVNMPLNLLQFPSKPHQISLIYTPINVRELKIVQGCWCSLNVPVPGLNLEQEFITPEEEDFLANHIDELSWSPLTNRRVQQFGHDFLQENQPDIAIPEFFNFILDRLENELGIRFDQITATEYIPGDFIAPHLDAHSSFEDTIVCLSLNSPSSMNFRHPEGSEFNQFLPPRSILALTDEARYLWKHSVWNRKYDIFEGISIHRRRRISLTFRKVRNVRCECNFPSVCDRNEEKLIIEETKDLNPTSLEKDFVFDTYDKIASHFSHTRYKPWPKVDEFLKDQEPFSLILDIGCGNGKYLYDDPLCRIGTDRSFKMLEICAERGFSVFNADCLNVPIRSNSVDVAIEIAVIHHLSTSSKRIQAMKEILRVLVPNGQALIYVWAREQTERAFTDQDCFVPWHLNKVYENEEEDTKGEQSNDPDKVVYKRFYHVFKQGELESLAKEAKIDGWKFEIMKHYYDRSNWCVRLKKVKDEE